MHITTWQEIINQKKDHIYLVGYGSLLNTNTHHSKKEYLSPVKVKGYKRIFSHSYPEHICNDNKYKERFVRSAKIHREDYNCKLNQLDYMNNSGAFEVIKDEQSSINGLILKIENKDFHSYMIREGAYELHKVEVNFYNEQEKLQSSEEVYILVKPKHINENCDFYYLYQKTSRIGAYRISEEFGREYDDTTYSSNHRLAYEELNKRVFKIGQEFEIKTNLITMLRFPQESENISKYDNKRVILLKNDKYLAKVLIIEDQVEIWLDVCDLSLIK